MKSLYRFYKAICFWRFKMKLEIYKTNVIDNRPSIVIDPIAFDCQAIKHVEETCKNPENVMWVLYDYEKKPRCVWENHMGETKMPKITKQSKRFYGESYEEQKIRLRNVGIYCDGWDDINVEFILRNVDEVVSKSIQRLILKTGWREFWLNLIDVQINQWRTMTHKIFEIQKIGGMRYKSTVHI
jgi:hypothetical protein